VTRYSINDVVSYADEYLDVKLVQDDPRALNGLQVENSGRLSSIAAAVDACQATIDAAAACGASLLVVHHGMFWGGLERLAGRHGRRVRTLHSADVALYSSHLPLDCHAEVGNNPLLARDLGLHDVVALRGGAAAGPAIGVWGTANATREQVVGRLRTKLGVQPRVIAAGPSTVRRVAVVTGAGASELRVARDVGVDTFVTGEVAHQVYFDAEEWGINLVLGGHYATETVGVQALAAHLARRFGVDWRFLDHPTGL